MTNVGAILLAGGLGTRLLEVTNDQIPKSLVEVAGKPIIQHVLDNLRSAGVKEVCLAVGHKSEAIQTEFGDRYQNMEITYSIEDAPRGTGGAAFLAASRKVWNTALVLNSDTYVGVPLQELTSKLTSDIVAVVLATSVPDVSRYGALKVDEDNVVGFGEKTSYGPGLIYAGVALINFSIVPEQLLVSLTRFSLENDVLAPLAKMGKLKFFESKSKFIDVGTPESFQESQKLLSHD